MGQGRAASAALEGIGQDPNTARPLLANAHDPPDYAAYPCSMLNENESGAAAAAIDALNALPTIKAALHDDLSRAVPRRFTDGSFDLLLPTLQKLGDDFGSVLVTDADGERFHLVADNWPSNMAAHEIPPAS